ncbi:MAG: hypothetical protein V3T05_04845 [Myxococcota bacterium]
MISARAYPLVLLYSLATLAPSGCGGNDGGGDNTPSTSYRHAWSTVIGGSADDAAVDAVSLMDGGAVVVGYFEGSVLFGSDTLTSYGGVGRDAFITRLDADGRPLWGRRFGGTGDDEAVAVAQAEDGTVVVAVTFPSQLEIDGTVLLGSGIMDAALIALSTADGTTAWYRQLGATGSIQPHDLEVRSGWVMVSGSFNGSVDFAGLLLTSSNGADAFVSAYAIADGTRQWTIAPSGTGAETAVDLYADTPGAMVLVGTFEDDITLGTVTLQSAGGTDIFLAAVALTDGAVTWAERYGGDGLDDVVAFARSDDQTFWLSGSFEGAADFAGSTIQSAGARDLYLAKLGTVGTVEWVRTIGGSSDDVATGIVVDPDGFVLNVGTVTGSVDLGQGTTSGRAGAEMFAAAYEPRLGHGAWSERYSGTLVPMRLVAGGDKFLVVGSIEGPADIGGQRVAANGGTDILITRLDWLGQP